MLDPEEFEVLRPRLKRLAYRMLGSWSEAEDLVQDTYLRLASSPQARNLEALARTTLARLCLDRLKSARARREAYLGEWLPEPVLDSALFPHHDPAAELENKETLAYGLLVLLEQLTPEERMVFVLREALSLSFREVAGILGKAEAGCRQLMVRARRRISLPQARGQLTPALLDRFIEALHGADAAALKSVFAEGIMSISDGGGKASAALRPLLGVEKVLAFLLGLARKAPPGLSWRRVQSNDQLCLLLYQDGELITAFLPQMQGEVIQQLFIMRNPDKLGALRY